MHLPTSSVRQLRATVAVAVSMFLMATTGLAATASPAASARAIAASVPRCATRSLEVWTGRWTVAAGTVAAEFGFTNHSSHACSLYGYPRVQMLKRSGENLSTSDQNASPGAFGIKEKTVVLASGETAYFGIVFHDQTGYGTLTCPTSAALTFTPPEDTSTVTLHGLHAEIAAYGGESQHFLHCGIVFLTPVTAKRFQ